MAFDVEGVFTLFAFRHTGVRFKSLLLSYDDAFTCVQVRVSNACGLIAAIDGNIVHSTHVFNFPAEIPGLLAPLSIPAAPSPIAGDRSK